jgi:hypothetical protein
VGAHGGLATTREAAEAEAAIEREGHPQRWVTVVECIEDCFGWSRDRPAPP